MEIVKVDNKSDNSNKSNNWVSGASQRFKQKFFKNMWLSILLICLLGALTMLILTLVFWFTIHNIPTVVIFFVLFLAAMFAACVIITLKSNVLIKPIVKKEKIAKEIK